jgi:hypothetical protein
MVQQAPFFSPSFLASDASRILSLLVVHTTLATIATAQTPQQQYVFGSVPLTQLRRNLPPSRKTDKGAPFPQ